MLSVSSPLLTGRPEEGSLHSRLRQICERREGGIIHHRRDSRHDQSNWDAHAFCPVHLLARRAFAHKRFFRVPKLKTLEKALIQRWQELSRIHVLPEIHDNLSLGLVVLLERVLDADAGRTSPSEKQGSVRAARCKT